MRRLIAALSAFLLICQVVPAFAAEGTDTLTLNQWVRADDGQAVKGRVVLPTVDATANAIANAQVVLSHRDGQAIRTTTDQDGNFSLMGLQPGVYALIARGPSGSSFACCALHVVDGSQAGSDAYSSQFEVGAAKLRHQTIKSAVVRYLAPSTDSASSIEAARLDALSSKVCGDDFFRVAQVDGGMIGRLHTAGAKEARLPDAGLANVFVLQGDKEVARTVSDESGRFQIDSLQPGQYSMVAVGQAGLAVAGFELVSETDVLQSGQPADSGYSFVTRLGRRCGCCREMAVQVAPLPEVSCCVEEVVLADPCCEEVVVGDPVVGETIVDGGMAGAVPVDGFGTPLAGGGFAPGGYAGGGGFAGGGGGGGGFVGGGGGLAGLAALGGIGGVIAATASDDDDQIIPPPVASPSTP
ncbi:MAG: carboxypeptidase-like regulatory domain-containing protein [Planctomycetota bacterium]